MANGHGGPREGSGKPPSLHKSDSEELQTDDPVAFLRAMMRDPNIDLRMRADAAKKVLAHQERAEGEEGKKGKLRKAAEDASTGRFAPIAPPKLVAVK